jgi:8-oxo-dGTP pyrophosphatase MutT (NUDIX family)
VRQLSSRVVYRNAWVSVREDRVERADGSSGVYSVVDAHDFALVLPFERDGFHLVEQYRYPLSARSWEFPSGSFPEGESGSSRELAAQELAEETGFTASRLEPLGRINPANAMTGQSCHVFLATGLTAGEARREATEQDMTQQWFPRAEVARMIRDGVIADGPSVAAFALFLLT